MPLLNVVGIDSEGMTFNAAFVWLSSESADDYIWAMHKFHEVIGEDVRPGVFVTDCERALINAIGVSFPFSNTLLCTWHIAKNVLARTKGEFGAGDTEIHKTFLSTWAEVCNAATMDNFHESIEALDELCIVCPRAVEYVKTTWLPYKEKFVRAWTDQFLHLGQVATSRVEGNHAMLKKRIEVSSRNLLDAFFCIDRAICNQLVERKVRAAATCARLMHATQDALFSGILSKVSKFACTQILTQLQMAKDAEPGSECTGVYRRTMGLPCSHELRWLRSRQETLRLTDIHPQWCTPQVEEEEVHTDDNLSNRVEGLIRQVPALSTSQQHRALHWLHNLVHGHEQYIQEPAVVRTRGRLPGNREPLSSTRRDPSLFEHLERPPRATYRCSRCGEEGHNIRRCPSRYDAEEGASGHD